MTKLRRIRWKGIRHTWERRDTYKFLVGNPQGKKHFEDQDVVKMIVLKWILKNLTGGRGEINFGH
jgi:hypothetical protein